MPDLARRILLLFLTLLTAAVVSVPAQAQKTGTKYYEDSENGFKFKPLKDWENIPVRDGMKGAGVIARFSGGKSISVKTPANTFMQAEVDLYIFRFDQPQAVTGSEGGGLRDRVGGEAKRPQIEEIIPRMFDFRDFKEEGMTKPIQEIEMKKLKKGLEARHATWWANAADGFQIFLDAWTVRMDQYDIVWLYVLPDQRKDNKKYYKAFESSLKSVQVVETTEAVAAVGQDGSYEEQLNYHKAENEKVAGWTAIPTPSKKYIIATSSDDKKFIEEVIERLEKSRDIFEIDFPPTKEMTHVSVVRICASKDEFSKYGGNPDGVAGYFNLGSTELVLYDSKNTDRRETLAVMSHEAFHQYCHFLFDRSEAHRWFDEGHGDWYGAYEFKGKKATPTAHMPGRLDRFPGIKTLVREERYKPIWVHINYDHVHWKRQGPRDTSCYEQSWSIIYFLRRGSRGDVPKKVWSKEYANIIPNYMSTLHEGFQSEYEKLRKLLREDRAKLNPETDSELIEILDHRIAHPSVGEETIKRIWDDAMAASWGQVDIEEFEKNWVMYIQDYLK